MAGTYYAVVDGDPLTSGMNSRVYAKSDCSFIDDDTGRSRRMVFIGDSAYCEKCDSVGRVVGAARVSDGHRLIDVQNGQRHQAVGGDRVLCKCSELPQIIAVHGRNWIIEDGDESRSMKTRAAASTDGGNHWITFHLKEQGNCEGLRCVAHFGDGSKEYGTFNAGNGVRFERASNGNACARVEFVSDDSADVSGSVTESILSAIAG